MKWIVPCLFFFVASIEAYHMDVIAGATVEYGNVKATQKTIDNDFGSHSTTDLSLTGFGGGVQGGGSLEWNALYLGLLGKISFMDRKGRDFVEGAYLGSSFFENKSLTQKMRYGGELRLGFKTDSLLFAVLGGLVQSKFHSKQGYKTTSSSQVFEKVENKYPLGGEIGFVFGYDLPWNFQFEGLFSYIFYQTIHVKEIHSESNSLKYNPRESLFSARLSYLF